MGCVVWAYWLALAVLVYTYAGYPLLVSVLSRLHGMGRRPGRGRDGHAPGQEPAVTVILAARNEAPRLGAKLENLLALDYPPDKLHIMVIDDGSTDATAWVARNFADRGVELVQLRPAAGKAAALNAGVARAGTEVVVFCDARQRIAPDAVRALVSRLADPEVGAVSGLLHMESARGPGLYWRYEAFIRQAESRLGWLCGATGALYAIRTSLYRPLPAGCLVDDMLTPLQIALQGRRVVLEPTALVYDREAPVAAEFLRKARTLAGNFEILGLLPELLLPWRSRLWLGFLSHKVLRLACPWALATLAATGAALATAGPWYAIMLAAQAGCYGLAALGALAPHRAGAAGRICHTFVVLNAAAVVGFWRFVRGDRTWTGADTARHDMDRMEARR